MKVATYMRMIQRQLYELTYNITYLGHRLLGSSKVATMLGQATV